MVYCMEYIIQAATPTAMRTRDSAKGLGLDMVIYSYGQILSSTSPEMFIQRCCEVTQTQLEEQLRFALVSDISMDPGGIIGGVHTFREWGHPAIGVTRYCDRLDFRKLGVFLAERGIYRDINPTKISPRKANLSMLGFEPGYVGIDDIATKTIEVDDLGYPPEVVQNAVPYIFDNQILYLRAACFPIGRGKTEELVVISASDTIGERWQKLLEEIIGQGAFSFTDLRHS